MDAANPDDGTQGGGQSDQGAGGSSFEAELATRLEALERQTLRRRLRPMDSPPGPVCRMAGRTLINFGSNDYLGLANHPGLKEAAMEAIRDYGAGSAASRLLGGSLAPHHRLEEALAEFKRVGRAISFSSGYAAATGTIPALVGPNDFIVIDKRVHACLVDAARLSGAKLRVFRHNDLDHLDGILRQCRKIEPAQAGTSRAILVVTESVFSMDGDFAPLTELVELKDRYGAWLMVDEAHGTGLFGDRRSGRIEAEGVSGRIEVQMGTLGKALGAAGGFIAGSGTLIDYLINRARSFIFSTAPPPAMAAAARAGLEIVQSSEGERRVANLRANVALFHTARGSKPSEEKTAPIVPVKVGAESEAVALAERLFAEGVYAPAVRFPTVARGQARLRLTFTAEHSPAQIEKLARLIETKG